MGVHSGPFLCVPVSKRTQKKVPYGQKLTCDRYILSFNSIGVSLFGENRPEFTSVLTLSVARLVKVLIENTQL